MMIRGQQGYKLGKFIETSWQFIKNATDLLLQTGSNKYYSTVFLYKISH
jgi:hypothetical protein